MVVEQNPLWIITTFVFGGTTVIFLLALVVLWFFMKPEGRYFFKQSFSGASLDNIRHEPVSNSLILGSLKWNGETFQDKRGIYYPLKLVNNPVSKSQEMYNTIISTASRWKGSKRPVVMTTDLMSFAISPEFYAAVEKAHNTHEYVEILPFLRKLSKWLEDSSIEHFVFMESFEIADIQQLIKDVGPTKVRDSFRKGVAAEQLKNIKLPGSGMFGGIPFWVIFLGLIAVVGVIGYFILQSGLVTF